MPLTQPSDEDTRTLAHRLAATAGEHGTAVALRYSGDGQQWNQLTYCELYTRAASLAAGLRAVRRTPEPQRVLIALPSGLDYVVSFYACLLAGSAAVTFYLPSMLTSRVARAFATRLEQVLHDCEPQVVLSSGAELARHGLSQDGSFGTRLMIDMDQAGLHDAGPDRIWAEPNELALVQYTSGSTSAPKGVMIGNHNLWHNVSGIARCLGGAKGEGVTSWLPLFHDLGLIGAVLYPLWTGMTVHLMSPAGFLRRPRVWLETISSTRSVVTMAPDFAYSLLARRLGDDDKSNLDLSCLRHAVNAAEPIRAETIDAFAKVFEPVGFARSAMMPAYGLAEHTLCATAFSGPQEPVLDHPPGDSRVGPIVGCGRVIAPDSRVAIVAGDPGVACPDGVLGEIWLSGPSVGQGYWGRPALTEATFGNHLPCDDERWLRTGDLGMVRDGVLHVLGRAGEVVVRNGVNHFLHDIEFTAGTSHPALEPGGGAAFTDAEQRLILVHELRSPVARPQRPAVVTAIRRAVAEEHGLRLDTVALLRRGKVPRTTSGKTQRNACAQQWFAGDLATLWLSTLDRMTAGEPS